MNIGVSFATASKLGLVNFKFRKPLPTLYFVLGGRCIYDCKFCTHARNSKADILKLSRVTWPEFPMDLVEKRLEILLKKDTVKRICFQVVSSVNYEEHLLEVIRIFKKFGIPISISVRPKSFEEVTNYFNLGIERIGIAVDAATKELFEVVKGGSWKRHIELIKTVALHFPNRVSTHLIIGLGETERQAVNFLYEMKEMNVKVALFAFTPIKGTKMADYSRPSVESYRKIQLARFLVFEKNIERDRILYEGEKIKMFKTNFSDDLINAFLTSGCDFCNRPFYNESPNGIIYNVPYVEMLRRKDLLSFSNLFRR
ncbi:MAG TPA: radical SAM protein [Thermotogaceae bacterium]|nr:radical SAM protein [Thermotogaceae bacterium]